MKTITPAPSGTPSVAILREAASTDDHIHLGRGEWLINDQVNLAGARAQHITADPEAVVRVVLDGKRAGVLLRDKDTSTRIALPKVVAEGHFGGQEAIIYSYGVGRLHIHDTNISGVTKGACISIRATKTAGVQDVLVENCKLYSRASQLGDREQDDLKTFGVSLNAEIDTGEPHVVPMQYWKTRHVAAGPYHAITSVVIRNNDIDGGYYAIGCSGVQGSVFDGNRMRNNMRGISLQDGSSYNVVTYNEVEDNISSGIHLAYGANGNAIRRNSITSARVQGEGQLQAYVGCSDNRFEGNTVTATSEHGAKYFAYCAVQSNGNVWEDNLFAGNAARAYFGIESDWNRTLPQDYHRGYNTAEGTDFMAGGDMHRISLIRNCVLPATGSRGSIFLLSAVNGYRLATVALVQNDFLYNVPKLRKIETVAGTLTGVVEYGNG